MSERQERLAYRYLVAHPGGSYTDAARAAGVKGSDENLRQAGRRLVVRCRDIRMRGLDPRKVASEGALLNSAVQKAVDKSVMDHMRLPDPVHVGKSMKALGWTDVQVDAWIGSLYRGWEEGPTEIIRVTEHNTCDIRQSRHRGE